MKVNEFNSSVERAATPTYDSWDREWTPAKISIKQAGGLQTDADNTYRDLMEDKITADEAYTQFNALEQQRVELSGYSAFPIPDAPNAIASDYAELKSSEFQQQTWRSDGVNWKDSNALNNTSTGIAEGVKNGEITAEQAADLREELQEHRENLKKLSGDPYSEDSLSDEEQVQVDEIHNRLAEMQDECGYVAPVSSNQTRYDNSKPDSPAEASTQNSVGPQQDDSKPSPLATGAVVLAIAALAALAFLFLPLALPLLVGVAGVAAAGVVAYRHGPEIMSAANSLFSGGAPRSTNQNTSQPEPEPQPDNNEEPDVENEQELDAEFDTPEVENKEEPEVTKPDADTEPSIPMQGLDDAPTQTKGDDLKNALHEIPEASPEKSSETQPTQDYEQDYESPRGP
jgi:hypothetical protein